VVRVVVLKLIIALVVVRVDLSTLLHTILHHLGASDLTPIFHYEGAHILAASLVKAQHVNVVLTPVREPRLINFDSAAKLAQLMSPVLVLEIDMDQLPYPTIDVINVAILETF